MDLTLTVATDVDDEDPFEPGPLRIGRVTSAGGSEDDLPSGLYRRAKLRTGLRFNELFTGLFDRCDRVGDRNAAAGPGCKISRSLARKPVA